MLPLRIIIAGGVTGGHLFPAIAIAEEFLNTNHKSRILFVSSGSSFETRVLSEKGFKLKVIRAYGIKGLGIWKKLKSLLNLLAGIVESFVVIKNFSPDLIIGVGSYSSAPVIIAARMLGIKIVLHEQNIVPGITNRFLSKIADKVYISFENTKGIFDKKKVLFTGNPLRKEIVDLAKKKKKNPKIKNLQF